MDEKQEVKEREILVAMVAGDFLNWLEVQGRKYGELCKILGISAKSLKIKILENTKEAIEIVKALIRSGQSKKAMTSSIIDNISLSYNSERKILLLVIAHFCLEWLKNLGNKYGEIAKIMGIPSKEGKLKILEIAEEAIEIIKEKYPIFAPLKKEEDRSAR